MNSLIVNKWTLACDYKVYNLNENKQPVIELFELQACEFFIEVIGNMKPLLSIGDYTITLKFIKSYSGVSYYGSEKIKCFQNFIGLTHAELYFEGNEDRFISSAISIFARKATCERALSFLRMINDKADISSLCFSVTQMNSDVNKSTKNITAMLKAGIKAIEYFKEQQNLFSLLPCSKLTVLDKIQKYNKSTVLDDRSIAYLCTNPDSLDISSAECGDLMINGRYYTINRIQTTSHQKDTDVFENQVMLAFVQTFLSYLKNVKNKLSKQKIGGKDVITFNGLDYLSIDRVFDESGLILDMHKTSIDTAIENSIRCISFIKKHIPCKIKLGGNFLPTPTQNVLARTHYLKMYELIKLYYDIGEPQWRGQLEFYGLRNLYKIFEFVCLVNLIESFSTKGYVVEEAFYIDSNGEYIPKRPVNEPCNYYKFSLNGVIAELFYEPYALQVKQINPTSKAGVLVDLVHTSKRAHRTWSPDFVIKVTKNGLIHTHVLDAKYSDLKSVRDHHIDKCVLKYTTKMMVLKNAPERVSFESVDSMHLLYSGDHDRYESYYTESLSLYCKAKLNDNPVRPIIGMLSHNENNFKLLSPFINDLLTI